MHAFVYCSSFAFLFLFRFFLLKDGRGYIVFILLLPRRLMAGESIVVVLIYNIPRSMYRVADQMDV